MSKVHICNFGEADDESVLCAGDEFIVLLAGVDTECVFATMDEINDNISQFNSSWAEPFRLSVSMGYAEFRSEDDAETFLRNMDEKMYEEKRKYHSLNQAEHLKKK